jgi:hypothetical protein
LLTEGFDQPRVDCIIMARPTRSKLLYAQMIGRGTRLHPDKADLTVIDVADNSRSHELPGLHSLFNLPMNMNLNGGDALEIEQEIDRISRTQPWIDTARIHTPEDIKLAAERIEFFNFDPPSDLAGHTQNMWYAVPGGYRLRLPDSEWLLVEPNLLDTWEVKHVTQRDGAKFLHRAESLITAIRLADRFVLEQRPDAARLVERSARWRAEPPTDKQKQLLARNSIPVPEGLTRGQASQMISLMLASSRRERRARP